MFGRVINIEAVIWRCSVKTLFLKVLQKNQSLFFNKVAGFRPATLLKKRLAQMFPCEFRETFNSFFNRTPLTVASVNTPLNSTETET